MVQRKDSLSYVEFMRGKYDLQNVGYLMKLLSNMTEDERKNIRDNTFDQLWTMLWSSTHSRSFMKEYVTSSEKFNKLRKGYLIRSADHDGVYQVHLDMILSSTDPQIDETEWGFPKGRRSFSDEDDRRCALREFREETGICLRNVRFIRDFKPFEEVFSGSNKVRYRHVYYVAKYAAMPPLHSSSDNLSEQQQDLFDPNNKHQAREIKAARWFSYKDAQDRIRETNVERKELLKRVNTSILKSFH